MKKSINETPIGEIIFKALKEKEMTQAEFAKIIKYSAPLIENTKEE